jgi:hypothetical protein
MGKERSTDTESTKVEDFQHPLVEQQRGFRMGWVPLLAVLGILAFAAWFIVSGSDKA